MPQCDEVKGKFDISKNIDFTGTANSLCELFYCMAALYNITRCTSCTSSAHIVSLGWLWSLSLGAISHLPFQLNRESSFT